MNAAILTAVATFAAAFCTLWAAHSFGDHWIQTHFQAITKGAPGWGGRLACLRHVATLTATKVIALGLVVLMTGLRLPLLATAAALTVDAASHYWADRSAYHADRRGAVTLERLADRLGKGDFYRLGIGTAAPCGTGAYALDQAWHHLWIFLTALAIAAGGAG
ncbi:transcriptional regulator [Streptosporangium sp. NPDC001559]|uniref:transcriptional regulator n=1 Tax=Streptosporangium sp. NPDC001559 TaxID=3366187 RepID=UPI0036E1C488